MSLTNALVFQFESGADVETVRHLLRALLAFVDAAGLQPDDIGLPTDEETILALIAPKPAKK